MLVTETVFNSEQITKYRFGALSEISNKVINKLNIINYMILKFRLKVVWKIS